MDRILDVGIDEFTVVFQGDKNRIKKIDDWEKYALIIANEVSSKLKLFDLFW
ncbi:hypothetical protein [Companilactobacillus sp.]|jgi:hypothetical protein|uniref:hypothetical protein n=1 Tax=Companilactobacillus sp. TaxID=2767905 RepID=UPI0025BFFECE|nr:hypothetical protein [Companilactobacillus sp.]MCH4009643.1 hypothetical protein [Companilactobacillus sp.]MCH4052681.1 hypothetical protein [Companilactobacillus sp.]MCH4077585.1 hypothetical protein [Companilactobacillus sp.]MCH4126161.1 hypothetical protein [Companilactobacillus sp.]MCI1311869.1 hypothetical protein [Companilactobacillus sp.]